MIPTELNTTPVGATPVVRQEVRDAIKSEFRENEYRRDAEAQIISADDAARQITYSFPATGETKRKWGSEIFALTSIRHADRAFNGATVTLDGDGKNSPASYGGAELADEGVIGITLKFESNAAYLKAKEAGSARLELRYHNAQWKFQSASTITVYAVTITGVGMLSPEFKVRRPRQRVAPLIGDPVSLVNQVRFADGATVGNVKIDAAKREAVVEFFCGQAERADGELVSLEPTRSYGDALVLLC